MTLIMDELVSRRRKIKKKKKHYIFCQRFAAVIKCRHAILAKFFYIRVLKERSKEKTCEKTCETRDCPDKNLCRMA